MCSRTYQSVAPASSPVVTSPDRTRVERGVVTTFGVRGAAVTGDASGASAATGGPVAGRVRDGTRIRPGQDPIFDRNSSQISLRSGSVETFFAPSSLPESKIACGTNTAGSSRISLGTYFFASSFGVA